MSKITKSSKRVLAAAGKTLLRAPARMKMPSRLSVKDQAFFAKRLSFLINSGVPILESLQMLREQGRSKTFSGVIDTVADDVANGKSLSRSLGRFPSVFGEFAVNIIRVGESTGILSQNLDYLADELKKKQALRRKTIGALVYPALITVATLGITAFLVVYLFPKIMPVFLSLKMQLPLSTRVVMAVSVFLQQWGILFLILLAAAGAACSFLLKKSKRFRRKFDASALKIPLFGRMIIDYNLANGTRTLGLLLKSGVTLSVALSITSETTKNTVYRSEWDLLSKSADRGERLSTFLEKQPALFPEILSQMIAVGERTGNLSNTFLYLSEFYEHEVDDLTKDMSSLIEPLLMVFMGLLIGFIAISIITPIYGITQNLHP